MNSMEINPVELASIKGHIKFIFLDVYVSAELPIQEKIIYQIEYVCWHQRRNAIKVIYFVECPFNVA